MTAHAAFAGVGRSTIERHTARSLLSFAHEAALDALHNAGVERERIDGYVGIGTNPNPPALGGDGADHVSAYLIIDSLGLGPLSFVSDVSGFAVNMAAAAAAAIRSGLCTAVLGVRAVSQGAGSQGGDSVRASGEDQWSMPFGAGPGGTRFAQRQQEYMYRTGARREDLFAVVRVAREHARLNPVAWFRDKELTLDEYLAAPFVAEPLCLYDCDLPVTGAGAFVMVAAAEAAREDRPAAYLRAHANWTDADRILDRAGLSPSDIDVCQFYDGYSCMVYEWLERLGWCDAGDGWKFVADGRTRLAGELPVNTFGGALGEGRLHGIGHLREGVAQVLGQAGDRQVPDVRHCLVQIGPHDRSAVAVLSREAE